ncbi:uncharacterized protein MELLADRAFT_104429 [Melampsora larici-populina 98AG31]|uniref:Uncharacterized protein n=1 Tax=Melampsora larici-populina (strain 98AG31 / pathotype 3-4-7) TaxID=747676 RepID=F4REN6_MELLP|nr:uncharacterized protein MELLADRAFT_104429 [Melampsora larici-populina 98AG31]EGG09247.1 hypothetical protein MELLADRAFT_104429 [Melampsora larici-populina 98AG31]
MIFCLLSIITGFDIPTFSGPGVFHMISYTENDFRSNAARNSMIKANGLLQKLEEMTLQKSPQSYRLPACQKKPSVTPYYRKPKFVRARTPEEPRRHRSQNNCSTTAENKDPKNVGKVSK